MSDYSIAGERIRALRELLGYTQKELAADAGISQSRLSKIETGFMRADDMLLETLADVAGVPTSFLHSDPVGITEGSLRFRKMSTASRSETKQVVQLTIEAYRICSDLAAFQGLPPPRLPQAQVEQLDVDLIEGLAESTREALGLDHHQPVAHVIRACERGGIFVVPLQPPRLDPDESRLGHSGVSTWRAPWEPALVGFLPSMPGDRLRHTLAHELGHLVLHSRSRTGSILAEREAHRFAGAFLMPRARALEAFSAARPLTLHHFKVLKAGWGMSIQSLIMRAWHLGVIDEERRRSLYRQLSVRGWRRTEPVKVYAEQPLLLYTLLRTRFGFPIDWSVAAEMLGLPGDIMRRLAPEPAKLEGVP